MNLQIIATAHNGFSDKFGIPRQSQEASIIETKIVFDPTFRDDNMLRGIEGFSHLWLIWEFNDRCAERPLTLQDRDSERHYRATVRPPRLGGNTRMGVFATRSPFRPNRLGLSSVELIRVEKTPNEGTVLIVRGADLLDGTPIYDIKPYLTYSDSHPQARNGFGEETKNYKLRVVWNIHHPQSTTNYPQSTILQIEEILSQDPRPAYQDDPKRIYKLDYAGWKVSFRVEGDTAYILQISPLISCGETTHEY